ELEAAAAGLPELRQPPPPVVARHLAPPSSLSLLGDVKLGGWLAVDDDLTATAVFGDAVVDLSSAALPAEGVRIDVRSVVGDVKVIVPDGARVQLQSTAVIGDRKSRLVDPIDGAPTVRIRAFTVLGDAAVYSLSEVPEGALRRLWTALRGGGGNQH
ncbi:MAG: LiaF domain-containing protein, partial [Actinomycetota bacterium]